MSTDDQWPFAWRDIILFCTCCSKQKDALGWDQEQAYDGEKKSLNTPRLAIFCKAAIFEGDGLLQDIRESGMIGVPESEWREGLDSAESLFGA